MWWVVTEEGVDQPKELHHAFVLREGGEGGRKGGRE